MSNLINHHCVRSAVVINRKSLVTIPLPPHAQMMLGTGKYSEQGGLMNPGCLSSCCFWFFQLV